MRHLYFHPDSGSYIEFDGLTDEERRAVVEVECMDVTGMPEHEARYEEAKKQNLVIKPPNQSGPYDRFIP